MFVPDPHTQTEFKATVQALLSAIAPFNQAELNHTPTVGRWTAAQITEHVLKSAAEIPHILRGTTQAADRQPDEKLPLIRSIFLDFTAKFTAREALLPSYGIQPKEMLTEAWEKTSAKIQTAMREVDLSRLCTDFPVPKMGDLTGYEWIWLCIYHTQRHIQQIHQLYTKVHHPDSASVHP